MSALMSLFMGRVPGCVWLKSKFCYDLQNLYSPGLKGKASHLIFNLIIVTNFKLLIIKSVHKEKNILCTDLYTVQ